VVSVNEISSVTITDPSMMISSEPIGSTSLLQLNGSDQVSPSPPSSQIPFGVQTSTGGFPKIGPLITPVQSLFIVPVVLLMPVLPALLVMVPELLMVSKLLMVPPALLIMVPELLMVPPADEMLMVPVLLMVPAD